MSFIVSERNAKKLGFEIKSTTVSGETISTSYSADDKGQILNFLIVNENEAEPLATYPPSRPGAAKMLEDF